MMRTNNNPTFPENIKFIPIITFNQIKAYSVKPKDIVQNRAVAKNQWAISPPLCCVAALNSSGDGTDSMGFHPVDITSFPVGGISANRFNFFKEILTELKINYLED